MSSSTLHEIDPRLRDTAADANAYSHHQQTQGAIQSPYSANATSPNIPRPLGPSPIHPQQYASPLQNNYFPQTPGSGGSVNNDGGDGTHEGGPNDPKRPRACEACRGLKVRCEPDQNNPEGPCKRCAKVSPEILKANFPTLHCLSRYM